MAGKDWRIKTSLVNNSETVSLSASAIGFTAIKALKGLETPLFFEAGQSQKIVDTFGYPNVNYPAIQDVLDYNASYPMYVSAPSGDNGLHGGVLVTKTGTKSLASGFSTAEISDFSAIVQEEIIGEGDGTTTTFNFTTKLFEYYTNQSIDILVDGISQAVSATDAEPEVLSTVGGDSGTFTRATGVLAYTFNTAPAVGEVIKVQYTIDVASDCYFALLSKGKQADDLAVIVTDYNTAGQFNIELSRQDKDDASTYNEFSNSPFLVSIIDGAKDGYGQPIYLDDVFDEDDWYIAPIPNLDAFDTFTDDTDEVPFVGGSRGDAITSSEIVEGFDYLNDTDEYPQVDLVFDTTGEGAVATKFSLLRGNDVSVGVRGRTKFLIPVANQSVADILSDTASAKNNIDERGINFIANSWMKHKDLYNDKPFICSGMGLVAKRYGDSKVGSYGALSPMYFDENGIGGQLGANVISLVNTASETQLKALNSAGIIGIKKISGSGFTIVGDRTSASSILSDYSFTIHSDLADWIITQIENQVLPAQIGKPNDALHRANVASKAELIMSSVDQYLDDYIVKCDEENNTDEVRARREFVLTISVIFTPNSQQINFIFVNNTVGTDLTQTV